jgi:hypothetical protein
LSFSKIFYLASYSQQPSLLILIERKHLSHVLNMAWLAPPGTSWIMWLVAKPPCPAAIRTLDPDEPALVTANEFTLGYIADVWHCTYLPRRNLPPICLMWQGLQRRLLEGLAALYWAHLSLPQSLHLDQMYLLPGLPSTFPERVSPTLGMSKLLC